MGFFDFLKSLFSSDAPAEKPVLALPAPAARKVDDEPIKPLEVAVAQPKPLPKPVPKPAPPPVESVREGELEVNFVAVFETAGVDATARERVTKAEDLLGSLPSEAPPEVKRKIVEASFRAFDVPLDKIVEAATSENDAIRMYVQNGQRQTREARADGAAKIAQLEEQIAKVREEMRIAAEHQKQREAQAATRTDAITSILRFFDKAPIPAPLELDESDMVESSRPTPR